MLLALSTKIGQLITLKLNKTMNNLVINKTSKSNVQFKVFFLYVDDCLAIFSNHKQIKQFYQEVNNIPTNINFTYELEEYGKIPFLDVPSEKINQLFISPVYRKKTST